MIIWSFLLWIFILVIGRPNISVSAAVIAKHVYSIYNKSIVDCKSLSNKKWSVLAVLF